MLEELGKRKRTARSDPSVQGVSALLDRGPGFVQNGLNAVNGATARVKKDGWRGRTPVGRMAQMGCRDAVYIHCSEIKVHVAPIHASKDLRATANRGFWWKPETEPMLHKNVVDSGCSNYT